MPVKKKTTRKKATAKKPVIKPKIAFAYKKSGNKYILASRNLKPGGKTMVKVVGVREVNNAIARAKEGKLKKVPFSMVILKTLR